MYCLKSIPDGGDTVRIQTAQTLQSPLGKDQYSLVQNRLPLRALAKFLLSPVGPETPYKNRTNSSKARYIGTKATSPLSV
jgi:hypothetical protein